MLSGVQQMPRVAQQASSSGMPPPPPPPAVTSAPASSSSSPCPVSAPALAPSFVPSPPPPPPPPFPPPSSCPSFSSSSPPPPPLTPPPTGKPVTNSNALQSASTCGFVCWSLQQCCWYRAWCFAHHASSSGWNYTQSLGNYHTYCCYNFGSNPTDPGAELVLQQAESTLLDEETMYALLQQDSLASPLSYHWSLPPTTLIKSSLGRAAWLSEQTKRWQNVPTPELQECLRHILSLLSREVISSENQRYGKGSRLWC